jgi:DNA helicase-2/ATP-dependent DNA helicase PcrA
MALNPDAIAALPPHESCAVYAGPGTGKTRLLIKRLNFLLRNPTLPWGEVACITYTNAAADEIVARLERGVRPAFLGTIHSFLLEHIVYPYGCWIDGVPADFDLVTTGYATPHLQWMQAKGLIGTKKAHVPDVITAFENIGYDLNGKLKSPERASLTQEEMRTFVDRRLVAKQVSQQDVLWLAWRILSNPSYEHILDALSCRFAAVLVDEFQDTSTLQFAVLNKLYEKGRTALFLVGDREQSIFSFAGANLKTYECATAKFKAHTLNINYRSTAHIIRLLNLFLEPSRRLVAGVEWKDDQIPVYILAGKVTERKKIDAFMELRDKYKLTGGGKSPPFLILARGTDTTRRLSRLRAAKPENGEDVFAQLEKKHRQLNVILQDIIRARRLLDLGELSRAFRSLDRGLSRLILKANPGFGAPNKVGLTRESWRIMVCDVLRAMQELNDEEIVPWLDGVQEVVKNAIVNAGGTKSGKKLVLLGKLKDNLKKKAKYKTDEAICCVDISEDVSSAVRTIHRAKGLEAEAVLLVAEKGQLTRWMNRFGSRQPRTEEARIGYVGFSRAMKLLCIATDTVSDRARETIEACGAVIMLLKDEMER